jgi:hypothetical protein
MRGTFSKELEFMRTAEQRNSGNYARIVDLITVLGFAISIAMIGVAIWIENVTVMIPIMSMWIPILVVRISTQRD